MTLRERLKAIVKTHATDPTPCGCCYLHPSIDFCGVFLDALCQAVQKVRPEPSVETLVELLRVRGIEKADNPSLIYRLMAWAKGETSWCPHMQRGSDNVWTWIGHVPIVEHIPSYCPECGAKRPKQ